MKLTALCLLGIIGSQGDILKSDANGRITPKLSALSNSICGKRHLRYTTNWQNIQEKQAAFFEDAIDKIINDGFLKKDVGLFDPLILSIDKDSKMSSQDKRYWKSYVYYNKSIFLKMSAKNDEASEKAITSAIKLIEDNSTTSEDYALLAACQSFSIQFANITQLASISKSLTDNANKSITLNSKNLRAYFVLASNNFYTPKMFGGGSKVQDFASKGLACPKSLNAAFYSPYWGKDRLLAVFIKYLNAEHHEADAKRYLKLAEVEYPDQFKK